MSKTLGSLKPISRWIAGLAVLACSGCATQRIAVQGMNPGYSASVARTQDYWFWGLGQSKDSYPVTLCETLRADFYRVDVSTEFSDAFVSLLTLGIYAPRTVTIYCRPRDHRKAPPLPPLPKEGEMN